MDRPIKVNFQGREVDAVEVDFKTIREDWNEYDLADGTRVKVKSVTSNMVRVLNEYDNDGNPIYLVKSSNVLALSVPQNLKRGQEKETNKIH